MLTEDQKRAGRLFRDSRQLLLDDLNAEQPPDGSVLPFWRVVRHECPDRGGASIGITLREHREDSPEYWVCYCEALGRKGADFPHPDCDGGRVIAAAGLFAWMWKEGRCSGCGRAVRSKEGRLIVVADRPAGNGRAAVERQGQAGAHPDDPRQPGA